MWIKLYAIQPRMPSNMFEFDGRGSDKLYTSDVFQPSPDALRVAVPGPRRPGLRLEVMV